MKNLVHEVYTSMQIEHIKLARNNLVSFGISKSDLKTCNLILYPKHELSQTMLTLKLVPN
jgi:hypothetical protein